MKGLLSTVVEVVEHHRFCIYFEDLFTFHRCAWPEVANQNRLADVINRQSVAIKQSFDDIKSPMAAPATIPVASTPASEYHDIILLTPTAQNYDWGRIGLDSEVVYSQTSPFGPSFSSHPCTYIPHNPISMQVAQLQEAAGQTVDPAKPYAELWYASLHTSPPTHASTHSLKYQHLPINL